MVWSNLQFYVKIIKKHTSACVERDQLIGTRPHIIVQLCDIGQCLMQTNHMKMLNEQFS